MGEVQRLRFGRQARIKQSRDFARVRAQGERVTGSCVVANWRRLEAPGANRLGTVTSSKLGGAVVRNRARRLLREVFRQHQHELARPVEVVLVARHRIVGKTFAQVESDVLTTLRKAGLLKQVSGSP